MNSSDLVSIICPTYNASEFIVQTIESVLAQTYENYELLIVDDCSSDNTVDTVASYLVDSRVKLFELGSNSGAAAARNKAIEMAKGRYIAFLDADDLWMPEKLAWQIDFMKKINSSFSYSEFELIDESGRSIGSSQKLDKSVKYSGLLKHCIIQASTAMYDVNVHGKVFCPLIRKRQDFGLFLSALREGATAHLVLDDAGHALRLATYRLRPGSVSGNKFKNIPKQWSIYYDFEKLGFVRSIFYMVHWFYNAGIKNLLRIV
jgi:teichuronic acid biosynthesis glycosyltransferase TuaG